MLGEQTGRPDIEGDWIANAPGFSEFPSIIEDVEGYDKKVTLTAIEPIRDTTQAELDTVLQQAADAGEAFGSSRQRGGPGSSSPSPTHSTPPTRSWCRWPCLRRTCSRAG